MFFETRRSLIETTRPTQARGIPTFTAVVGAAIDIGAATFTRDLPRRTCLANGFVLHVGRTAIDVPIANIASAAVRAGPAGRRVD